MPTIPARFNGPPGSGNGGYVCGLVAGRIGAGATVRLQAPPPLETPLDLRTEDGVTRLRAGETVVAEGREGRPDVTVPAPPGLAEAAATRFVAAHRHPFPGCFVCGPRHPDGMRIFPGPVDDAGTLACVWRPTAEFAADPRFVWAALDCPSGFACMPPGSRTVLGSMTARLEAPVEAGRDYVITAWPVSSAGRKHRAGSALHTADGRLVAAADAVWITLAA